jgi:HK97 family phage prohead protease
MSKPLHLPEGREARVVTTPPSIEYRALDGGGQEPVAFVGQAIVCGVRSSPLGYPGFRFVEIIAARALDATDMSDVIGVFNHDPNLLLGRTRNNTLTLTRSQDGGLSYRIPYDPADPDHQRVMRKIERGDVDGSSFLFRAKKDDWQEEQDAAGGCLYVRTVLEIETLYDVCPVTSPAYPDATAAKRSHDAFQQEHPRPPTAHHIDQAMRERELELAAY